MNFKDCGCKDLEVQVGQMVRIANRPRHEYGMVGQIIKIRESSSLYHTGNIIVQFNMHKERFCACELTHEN